MSGIAGTVLLLLGISYLGALIYGWTLGILFAPILHIVTRPVKPYIKQYLRGLCQFSKAEMLVHTLCIFIISFFLLALPIIFFLLRKNCISDILHDKWVANINS
jgi:hypothetical protein